MSANLFTERTCHFSLCRKYRYSLKIVWDATQKPQMFIGLNPSTADEETDDPTIRRCIDFAQQWGRGGLVMVNLFAYRSTEAAGMLRADEPIGPENTVGFLQGLAWGCDGKPIAAWGVNAAKWKSGKRVAEFRESGPLNCLRITKHGAPEHPLYLPKTLTPIPWNY